MAKASWKYVSTLVYQCYLELTLDHYQIYELLAHQSTNPDSICLFPYQLSILQLNMLSVLTSFHPSFQFHLSSCWVQLIPSWSYLYLMLLVSSHLFSLGWLWSQFCSHVFLLILEVLNIRTLWALCISVRYGKWLIWWGKEVHKN
jgi:hypothetical protein